MAAGGNGRRFAGKVAVLTGAASGIGRATALRLAAEGAEVLGHDFNADGLEETAEMVRADGGTMETRSGDISSREECFATVEQAVETFGRIDVLGNIAGLARADHATEVTEEIYRKMMGVNTDAYFFMCQAAIPHLLTTGGNIVNIASNAGLMGMAYSVVYTMSKGAVVQLTRSLAMEYIKSPLRVNAIAPGGIKTGLTANYHMPADVDFELVRRYMNLRPVADPEVIAGMFAYVASDEASNVHGAILANDSGLTTG
jgi:meso-butanediol dehydrogenase / (S,S)-butanediol dehydrogenase / diacetyl reductase